MNEKQGLEGERGNPRRGFPNGDEAQALSILLDKSLKSDRDVHAFLLEFKGLMTSMVTLSSFLET